MIKYLLSSLFILLSCSSNEFRNPYNAPFDGTRFKNLESFPPKSFFSLLKWKLFMNDKKQWPEWIDLPLGKKPKERTSLGEVIYTVVNHATVLLQVDGFNILTDQLLCLVTQAIPRGGLATHSAPTRGLLKYTSHAADEDDRVDLGGRPNNKKK